MQNIDVVEQFRKCWDLASELAEKETKERFEGVSYLIETVQEGGNRKGEPTKMRRVRISKGEYKLRRLEWLMVVMIDMFAIQYRGGDMG